MVELNHCWVQLTHCWVKILQFISSSFLQTAGLTTDHPPVCMTSPPLTLPLYIPFLYSSLQFFSTSSLLPLSPHRSQDHPSLWLAPIWHSLSTFPFYTPSLTHLYPLPTSPRMSTPPLTLPLYLHSLSILLIYCHKTIPPIWLAPLWHSLSTFPFYTPYLLTYH